MKMMQLSAMGGPIFIGKWTPKILFSLKDRPFRHGKLRRHLGSVSQRMLTRTLGNLESAGLIDRRVTKSKTGKLGERPQPSRKMAFPKRRTV
jgi:HxlR-like helix-turn-helix